MSKRQEENNLRVYRKEAIRVAKDLLADKVMIDKIKQAKNETQIINIMVDIRRAV